MAVIERLAYDTDGDLLAPSSSALASMSTQIGGRPTTDTGLYHRHSFRAYSPAERDRDMAHFFDFMSNVRGFSSVIVKTYDYDFIGLRIFGAHVVYAIEAPARMAIPHRS